MGKSNSEVGHAKNAANLVKLQQITVEMGPLYQPSNTKIQPAAFNTFTLKVTENTQQFASLFQPYKDAVATRKNTFEPLFKLSTRVLNSFKALQLPENIEQNLINLTKKLKGERIKPLKADKMATEETNHISVSQLSYDNQVSNFENIIAFLAIQPLYTPNETELTLVSLKQYLNELKAANKLVSTMTAKLIIIRHQRNKLLYTDPINVIDVADAVKDYLKSIKEAKDYYKAAVKLKFATIIP
ncbi:hypothetical protein [Flavobacterium soli]|uniref:hypothetical protein n=1 Tax=Flavobacterium soli TaxID=344881 RepID=UPI000406A85D|nr:hypothetical protein [Flavobacterium soli]